MPRFGPAALRRVHLLTDCALVSLGWIAAYGLRSAMSGYLGVPINPLRVYITALPLIVLPWMCSCWMFGIYRRARTNTPVDELQAFFRGVALGLLVVSAISFFFRELALARAVVLASAGINLLLQGASRICFHQLERRMRRSGEYDVRALVVGTGVAAIRLLQKLQDHPEIGYRVVGLLDESSNLEEKDVAGYPVLGGLDELRRVASEFEVREVFIAAPALGHTRMLALVLDCEDLDITFRVVTKLFEVLTSTASPELVDDVPLVRLGRQDSHLFYAPLKRAFDVVGALLGLLLTAPFLAWCIWRIRRTSEGAAVFRQDRVGTGGKVFGMFKLRTMHSDAEPYAAAPRSGDDPRITSVGRWLRQTSADELPQLLNVLRGDMSLVGPRPEMPFIASGYDEWQRRRLAVKPGITGLWQILGRKDLPMHDNLQYDFYYIRNRSLALDISILIRTTAVVLARRGAF